MRIALSTNWCNRRIESGLAIAQRAKALGFDALELGFRTTEAQAREIRESGLLPIGSIHAFCPVPISAPQGYPELYQLVSTDEEDRKMAHLQIVRNIRFAAKMGATAVVLHAGRVDCRCWLSRNRLKKRMRRGAKLTDIAKRELDALVPELESCQVRLGLENLPYLEGYPLIGEWTSLCGEWVRPWYDTGHDHCLKPQVTGPAGWMEKCPVLGLHVNDSVGGDDHLPPGEGQIDFVALRPLVDRAEHIVFEPNENVSEERLKNGLEYFKKSVN